MLLKFCVFLVFIGSAYAQTTNEVILSAKQFLDTIDENGKDQKLLPEITGLLNLKVDDSYKCKKINGPTFYYGIYSVSFDSIRRLVILHITDSGRWLLVVSEDDKMEKAFWGATGEAMEDATKRPDGAEEFLKEKKLWSDWFAEQNLSTVPSTFPKQKDVTFSIRKEAKEVAVTLISCGMQSEEAYDTAIHKMPGSVGVNWWKTELFPRFTPEQQEQIRLKLNKYMMTYRNADEKVSKIAFIELVMVEIIQKKQGMSSEEAFQIWQNGLALKAEDWWTKQMANMNVQEKAKFGELRKMLLPAEN